MKKFTAAAVAATMAVSLAAGPADAASNTMAGSKNTPVCKLELDGIGSKSVTQEIVAVKGIEGVELNKLTGIQRTAAAVGEAFGSTDTAAQQKANNAQAVQACLDGEDYKSEPLEAGIKGGIIATVVLAVLGLIANFALQSGAIQLPKLGR